MNPLKKHNLAYFLVRECRSTPEMIQDSLVSSLDKTQDWDDTLPVLALQDSSYFPQGATEAHLYQLRERKPSDGVRITIVGALLKHSTQSLFTSTKILRVVYQSFIQMRTREEVVFYIQDGLVCVISWDVKKRFVPAMDVEEIKSVLFEEAAKLGNALVNYYKRDRRPGVLLFDKYKEALK
ncbi:hypothetical protein N7488_004041 [Penicillium malachiteum]|nr:hypothetical protein N7488_004041 [Penicillium malachiteum]